MHPEHGQQPSACCSCRIGFRKVWRLETSRLAAFVWYNTCVCRGLCPLKYGNFGEL